MVSEREQAGDLLSPSPSEAVSQRLLPPAGLCGGPWPTVNRGAHVGYPARPEYPE